jgi:hypothetical protein
LEKKIEGMELSIKWGFYNDTYTDGQEQVISETPDCNATANRQSCNCWRRRLNRSCCSRLPFLNTPLQSLTLRSLAILVATKIQQTKRKEALSIDDYFKEVIYLLIAPGLFHICKKRIWPESCFLFLRR